MGGGVLGKHALRLRAGVGCDTRVVDTAGGVLLVEGPGHAAVVGGGTLVVEEETAGNMSTEGVEEKRI